MHSLLEKYLSEVAAHLSALPTKQRTEELREMRAHLENAVTINKELGQSDDDAMQNAVMQFGTPEDLGDNLVWAWRRGLAKNKRSFWSAASCTFAVLFFVPVLVLCLPFGAWMPVGFGLSPLIAGIICGSLFWRRGSFCVGLGTALYYYVFGMGAFVYGINSLRQVHLAEPFSRYAWLFFAQQTEALLFTLFVAWIAGRLRLVWNKRRELARV